MRKLMQTRAFYPTLLSLLAIVIMLLLPNSFENEAHQNYIRSTARILSTDNSLIKQAGLISYGEQVCQVEILEGRFKGVVTQGINFLSGKLEQDKSFKPGEKALILINAQATETLSSVTLVDHYRLNMELFLVIGFFLLLVVLAGWLGVRAIISFFFTVLAIWKVLIPAILFGFNPILVGLAVVSSVSVIIIVLVFGWDRRFFSAVLGALLGSMVTALIAYYFVGEFKIHKPLLINRLCSFFEFLHQLVV